MLRYKLLVIFALLATVVSGSAESCKRSPDAYKPNRAELGENWETFKHDASFNCWVFTGESRPPHVLTSQGARVYSEAGALTQEELQIIDTGLSEMLQSCRRNTNAWNPTDLWTKFLYFQRVSDYKVMVVPSNYTLQEGESAGCAGMITGAHGAFTAAGTVCGLIDKFNSTMPASKGGVYITVPRQSPEQIARSECKTLMKDAVRNEGEHVWFTNDTVLYFAYANDGYPANGVGHPYCVGTGGQARKPIDVFNITEEEVKEFRRKSGR